MTTAINLGRRSVGPDHLPFVIAEIGANHNGDLNLALELIDAAAEAGADAAKFQSWTADSLVSKAQYAQNPQLRAEVERHVLTAEAHQVLRDHCVKRGIAFCSTSFTEEEVDMLDSLEVPFFKVASMDVVYPQLLRYIARKRRPIILSTGMANIAEIYHAIEAIRSEQNEQIILLHCVAVYPPEIGIINLNNIGMLRDVFGLNIGFSDHTIGVGCALAAIALGANVIEKHFTLDKNMEGWDHKVSATPDEMATIVREGRQIFTALGTSERTVSAAELRQAQIMRRSLISARDLKAGERLSGRDIFFKRPGTGILPDSYEYALGRELAHDIPEGMPITWDDLNRT